ncbi:hypothetical protein Z517_03563 [Fonsecaea pedrosoi CBS 271.37]|uniref:Major facilitator superfamily (MFS) profile domain-containing protein n=1 Tax=Fonsecaea pedrosoi CBS 271.37 TaxID=1442368 RepID=A0A0D2GTH6_9EURO|nr:uncharacterized protein Z517_03563 [Fonsecaea pedrosoi CBS 271.37]KIW84313.1 hypothetical protein Z517_03563 [Fonsecaea pedrosoi CBS 271.37]
MIDSSRVGALKELELNHADAEGLEDITVSNALATDQAKLTDAGYFHDAPLIGTIAGSSLVILASYWAFSPAAAILVYINEDIGPSDNASLFSIVWSLCTAISMVIFGRVSDKFGRRWFLLGASGLGILGGIVACTAKTMNTLIGANVLLGLGAGVHTCYTLFIGEICPNKYKYLGIMFTVIPNVIPTGFGAYLALMLVHNANWRWVYYIEIMIMVPGLILQYLYYRPPTFHQLHGGNRTRWQEFRRVDHLGLFLLCSGLTLFILGISWGGQPLPWTSGKILGLIISGGVLLIIFAVSKVPNKLVPLYFFRDLRGFVCLITIEMVSGTIYIALSIIWPSQVAQVYGAGATGWQDNAWLSTTVAFGIWGGIVLCGSVFHIVKHVRLQLIIYMIIVVAFSGALASGNTENKGQSAAFSFLTTFPVGILEVVPGILVQLEIDDTELGTAFAILGFLRTAFGSIMTAVFLAILTSKIPTEMAHYIPGAAINAGLPQSSLGDLFKAIAAGTTEALDRVPGITEAIVAAVAKAKAQSYAAAYAYVYYSTIAIGAVGLIAVFSMKDYDPLLNDHVSRQVYKKGETVPQPYAIQPEELKEQPKIVTMESV